MSSWHSYPKIYNVGHPALDGYLDGYVQIEEKVDGSQFSFGMIDGELLIRSKGVVMNVESPEKMFSLAAQTVLKIAPLLTPGWTYRGEFLSKPKHNTLAYTRVPTNNIMIFDINPDDHRFLSYEEKYLEATRLGLECVPLLWAGSNPKLSELQGFLNEVSILGGVTIEGFVIKRYDLFGADKKVLLAKHVSESFKEKHSTDWKTRNPGRTDVLLGLIETYRHPHRWQKAVQHLAERGELTNSPKDIGKLMAEVKQDVIAECAAEIKEVLFKHFAWQIERGVAQGLAEWYKEELLKKQVGEET